jgi:hypothetical protein
MSVVSYLVLESKTNRFVLRDILENRAAAGEPHVTIRSRRGTTLEQWDNVSWIKGLHNALKSDAHTHHYLELMTFCDHYGWDFTETLKELGELFEKARDLNILD